MKGLLNVEELNQKLKEIEKLNLNIEEKILRGFDLGRTYDTLVSMSYDNIKNLVEYLKLKKENGLYMTYVKYACDATSENSISIYSESYGGISKKYGKIPPRNIYKVLMSKKITDKIIKKIEKSEYEIEDKDKIFLGFILGLDFEKQNNFSEECEHSYKEESVSGLYERLHEDEIMPRVSRSRKHEECRLCGHTKNVEYDKSYAYNY